jgi:hypothetical protein
MNAFTGSVPVTLVCHPQTPSQAVRGIEAVATLAPGVMLTLAFGLEGELSRLRIPEPRPPRRTSGLWRHTCFEVFVMEEEGPGYREFNFSPSGEWAAYVFRGYRDGAELEIKRPPELVVRRSVNRLEMEAQIFQELLPAGRPLRLGLSAVVEEVDGVLSYWALRQPPGRPDFHHTDAFALQLA